MESRIMAGMRAVGMLAAVLLVGLGVVPAATATPERPAAGTACG